MFNQEQIQVRTISTGPRTHYESSKYRLIDQKSLQKYLIPTYWIVRNENICISGLLKAMLFGLLLEMAV